jgi:hypothetical protein
LAASQAEAHAAKIDDLVDDFLEGPLAGLLSICAPHRADGAMLWTTANGLHRSPHVLLFGHEFPAGRQERFSLNLAAFVDALCGSNGNIAQETSPCYIAVLLDYMVGNAAFEWFFRESVA